MGITTSFLEYAVLAYVMAIVITTGLYILEHYEIRYVNRNETENIKDNDDLLTYTPLQ